MSLHWLDFGYTTGLSAIDYYLTDWPTVPQGSEALFSETPWRLDGPALAYRPDPAMGEVSPLPAIAAGFVTFGSLTRAVRINHRTVRVWSAILQQVPGARLVIDSRDFSDKRTQEELAQRFGQYGISRERLLIGCHSPPWDTLRGIDITLDCFPHNSGTTLLESLYMGLPFVTLAGRPSVGTLGHAILAGLGQTEWVAHSEDEYVAIAVALAADWPRLAAIRANLRAVMQNSPLMDETGFTRRVEAAYRQMFAAWAQQQQRPDPAGVPQSTPEKIASHTGAERASGQISFEKAASVPADIKPPTALAVPDTADMTAAQKVEAMIAAGLAAQAQQQLQQAAVALFEQQRWPQVETVARLLTTYFEQSAFNWKALAMALSRQGLAQAAVPAWQRAIALSPHDPELLLNLGRTLQTCGQLADAEQAYRSALPLNPSQEVLAAVWCNLGVVLNDLGRLQESQHSYQQALHLQPESAVLWNNLGASLDQSGQLEQALACFERALQVDPQYASAHSNRGNTLKRLGRLAAAEQSMRLALAIEPDFAQAQLSLGDILKDRGQLDQAEACFETVLLSKPDFAAAYHNLFFTLNYHPDRSAEQIFAAYRRFDQALGLPWRSQWQRHDNDRSIERRLKVGYVAATFYHHSSRHFLEPLLAHHDKGAVEVFLYAQQTRADASTRRYQSYADHWISTLALSDDALAERIRADGIDVLVDIAGHTGGNRLLIFARKPAPVSLHWLDFGYTTGLSAIDYYLTDWATVPAGGEALFSETPWRLDRPALAYRPDVAMGEASPLPAIDAGFVTFGSLTRAVRINHRTLRVWSQILLRLPGSKLVIDSADYRDPAMQDELAQRFAEHGIDRTRLLIGFHSPPWDVLRGIDITLDCFPHNSGTTLLESLYLGVPFVTLAGRPSVGTLGCAILSGLGHTEWVAHSEDEYIGIAVALAADLPSLAGIRAGLRTAMQGSPLMDEVGFARRVEAAYRAMWSRFCDGENGLPIEIKELR